MNMTTIYKGTILGFSGSWGSGIGYLKIKDSRTGKIKSVACENAETVRALQNAFGDTISEGHTVNPKGGYVGEEIYYQMESWGTMAGFEPVYDASVEIEEAYEKQFEKRTAKAKKPKGWHMESARHSLARKGIKTGRKK